MNDYVGRRGGALPAPLSERLWRKVQVGPGCWDWLGAKNSDGYPVLWDGKRLTYAHRIAYEMVIGPVPDQFDVDHTCRNRTCVNPAHLEAVTHRENVQRAWRHRRDAA
jgi:hypothetical protein